MKTITFYSYKGGVGRTLALANVASNLAGCGFKVVVMDFDLEAPGLHYKFAPSRPEGQPLRGVLDLLHDFVTQGKPPTTLEGVVYPVMVDGGVIPNIQMIPAGEALSDKYWKKLAAINWHDLFYSEPAPPGIPLFEELRRLIEDELQPDFLLIDARTGVTEIGGVSTTVLSDIVVCMLLNNLENLEGARAVIRAIRRAPWPEHRQTPVKIIPVLTRIPETDDDTETRIIEHVRSVLNKDAEELVDTLALQEICVLHSNPVLQMKVMPALELLSENRESVVLYMDYVYLISRMVTRESLNAFVNGMVNEVKMLNDPGRAMFTMSGLFFYTGHPHALEAFHEFDKIFEGDDRDISLPRGIVRMCSKKYLKIEELIP
jgi:MinD-like ATPase involved in chromosome partitioning or flagellar assembly